MNRSAKQTPKINVFELIGKQLSDQGQTGVALQTICAALLSEICMLHPDPTLALDRITARLIGTAMGVSHRFADTNTMPGQDTGAITQTMEMVAYLAENQVSQASSTPSEWKPA